MNVANSANTAAGTAAGVAAFNSNGAYAVSLIGKNVTVNQTNEDGTNVLDSGIVDSVEIENGEYGVVVNGLGYRLDSVVKVRNGEDSAEDAQEDTETKTI